jgi:hypothetical protein
LKRVISRLQRQGQSKVQINSSIAQESRTAAPKAGVSTDAWRDRRDTHYGLKSDHAEKMVVHWG